jgi:hypothetical protein
MVEEIVVEEELLSLVDNGQCRVVKPWNQMLGEISAETASDRRRRYPEVGGVDAYGVLRVALCPTAGLDRRVDESLHQFGSIVDQLSADGPDTGIPASFIVAEIGEYPRSTNIF